MAYKIIKENMDIISTLEKEYNLVKPTEKDFIKIMDFLDNYSDAQITENIELYKKDVKRHIGYYKGVHKILLLWHYVFRRFPIVPRVLCKVLNKDFDYKYFKYGPWFHEFYCSITRRINELKGHRKDFEWIYERLEDDKSREVLLDVIMWNITHDIKYTMAVNDIKNTPQYFDSEIIRVEGSAVFVDMGTFIGDTILSFIEFVNIVGEASIKKIYGYEPDAINYQEALNKTKSYEYVEIRNLGVGSKNEIVLFKNFENGRSRVSKEKSGTVEVKLVSIDEDITERVSFIKMDLEGYESEAILGAKKHIINDKPQLAICVYHHIKDLYTLAQQIEEYNPNYKMYMRHYDSNGSETVLYCV